MHALIARLVEEIGYVKNTTEVKQYFQKHVRLKQMQYWKLLITQQKRNMPG